MNYFNHNLPPLDQITLKEIKRFMQEDLQCITKFSGLNKAGLYACAIQMANFKKIAYHQNQGK
jgi:hypothetical protein